ncbi:hypothetical protein DPMN_010748 [Dreissena polymorpha]|uniref:G-protein coupled receptors family 1 profile domain-containing protein n=1 Tax=Dreissena polymorpha TaxID=45954 RepID=A0A9D4N2Q7_DREPO|nr:hypothetical protein DPMN_010748 [Dreissena polymorpha]
MEKETHISNVTLTAEQLSKDLQLVILPVTCLLFVEITCGIVGNILIIIVYYNWYKVSNFRCFVLYMACIDLISSITTLPGEILSHVDWYTYDSDGLCKAKSFFNVFTVWASGLLLLILAYDRNRKICQPLSWQIPTNVAARLCIASVAISTLLASPIVIFWGKQSYAYEDRNVTTNVSICEKSDMFANGNQPFLFIECGLVGPMALVIMITTVFNVRTGKTLVTGILNYSEYNGTIRLTEITENGVSQLNGHQNGHLPSNDQDAKADDLLLKRVRRNSFPAGQQTMRNKPFHKCHAPSNLKNISEIDTEISCKGNSKIVFTANMHEEEASFQR